MRLKLSHALVALAMLATPACSTLPPVATSHVVQVNTLGDALQAATVVTRAVDLYVNTASPDRGTLLELRALNNAVHTALDALVDANNAGKPLDFAAFRAALDAYNAYATSKGV